MPFASDRAGAPAGPQGPVDFSRTLKFVFEDPEWVKKLLIGSMFLLLSMVLVGTFFVLGYFMRLIRRAAGGEERPLPEWDDLGGIFGDGVKAVGLYLVYVLPPLLILVLLAIVAAFLGGGMASVLHGSEEAAGALGALLSLGVFVVYLLFCVLMLAFMFLLPAPLTRLALSGEFRAGLELREGIAFIRRNLANYVLALTFYLLASFVAQFGVLLCCVGVFPLSFWSLLVLGFGLGETARRDPGSRISSR
jgi:hypothetical protein